MCGLNKSTAIVYYWITRWPLDGTLHHIIPQHCSKSSTPHYLSSSPTLTHLYWSERECVRSGSLGLTQSYSGELVLCLLSFFHSCCLLRGMHFLTANCVQIFVTPRLGAKATVEKRTSPQTPNTQVLHL